MGELTVAKSPDCNDCPREYKRKPVEVIVHEKFDDSISQSPYDLALIRVNRSLTLFDENESGVVPICLPWHSMLTVESKINIQHSALVLIIGQQMTCRRHIGKVWIF